MIFFFNVSNLLRLFPSSAFHRDDFGFIAFHPRVLVAVLLVYLYSKCFEKSRPSGCEHFIVCAFFPSRV